MSGMNDAVKLKRMVRAAARLLDSIMRDEGGFCLETLHSMTALAEAAGLPDYTGVTAVTGWSVEGHGDEPRFWGEGAMVDAESN